MAAGPTYVIGVGGVGVAAVAALEARLSGRATDRVGLMAVDADRAALEGLSSAATVHLVSDSGVVDGATEACPFLADDVVVPAAGADRRRHVGRYKLDNPVSPTFETHQETVYRHIERFFDRQQVRLDPETGPPTVLLVGSLADGTGSGVIPLLAAAVDHAAARLDPTPVRLFGVGVVPPLGVDPEYRLPPVEPVSYLNTYAALRNLSTLFGADESDPLEVPVYGAGGDGRSGTFAAPGRTFTCTEPPFDGFWLLDGEAVGRPDPRSASRPPAVEGVATVAHACAVTGGEVFPDPTGGPLFGTVGYGSVAVPHGALREYCEHRCDRRRKRERLEAFVAPKLRDLRAEREELGGVLRADPETEPVGDGRVEALYERLEGSPDEPLAFVEGVDPDRLDAELRAVAEEFGPATYLRTAVDLRWALAAGPVGSAVRSAVRRDAAEVRDAHGFGFLSEHEVTTMSLPDLVAALGEALSERREELRRAAEDATYGFRDVFPPTHDLLTSEHERIERRLERLEASLERVGSARSLLGALEALRESAEGHVREGRRRVRERLDELERETTHFLNERDRLREELEALERAVAVRREALANPDEEGPRRTVPLEWDALAAVSLEAVDSELTSLQAYRERGLLRPGSVEGLLADCYEASRDWPKALTQHTAPVASDSARDTTSVLYHERNGPAVEDAAESFVGATTTWRPTGDGDVPAADPYRIDVVSVACGGPPESLRGFRRLSEMDAEGILEAVSGAYRDHRRALAYPEWYDGIGDAFD